MYALLRCIFDRFWELIIQLNPKLRGWGGTYNGELSPSDDYWITAQLIDIKGLKEKRKGTLV